MKFKLKKLSTNKNNLRTEEAIGDSDSMPIVGESFAIIGKSLELVPTTGQNAYRLISTSIVASIEETEDPNVQIIHTLNSVYEITMLADI